MIEDTFTWLSESLSGSYWIAAAAAFGWGVLSILLSPCHLSSIPLIVGYISSQKKISISGTLIISVVFSTGILVSIAGIGLITASMGRLMGDIGSAGNYFVAFIFCLVGLILIGFIKIPWNVDLIKTTGINGLGAAFILGLIFGIALGPCTFAFMAPVLGVVFQTSQTNFLFAVLLLSAFGLGHCFVIAGAGTLIKRVQIYLNWTEESKAIMWMQKICGILVIFGGIYLIYIL